MTGGIYRSSAISDHLPSTWLNLPKQSGHALWVDESTSFLDKLVAYLNERISSGATQEIDSVV